MTYRLLNARLWDSKMMDRLDAKTRSTEDLIPLKARVHLIFRVLLRLHTRVCTAFQVYSSVDGQYFFIYFILYQTTEGSTELCHIQDVRSEGQKKKVGTNTKTMEKDMLCLLFCIALYAFLFDYCTVHQYCAYSGLFCLNIHHTHALL